MRISIVALSLAGLLAGCSGMNPMTREEFVEMNRSGKPFSMVDTYVAKRKFTDVVASLKKKTTECFNVDVTTKRTEGGMTTSNVKDEFRTRVEVINASRAELTTQYTSKGIVYMQEIPKGGFYHRAVDIEKVSATTTKLTYYGSSFESSKLAWAAIKDWSDGKQTPCP